MTAQNARERYCVNHSGYSLYKLVTHPQTISMTCPYKVWEDAAYYIVESILVLATCQPIINPFLFV